MINKHKNKKLAVKLISAFMVILIVAIAIAIPCSATVNVGQSTFQTVRSTFPLTVGFEYDRGYRTSATLEEPISPYMISFDIGGAGQNYNVTSIEGEDNFTYQYLDTSGTEWTSYGKIEYKISPPEYKEYARITFDDDNYIKRGQREFQLTPYGILAEDGKSFDIIQRYKFYADEIYLNGALLLDDYNLLDSYLEYGLPTIKIDVQNGAGFNDTERYIVQYKYKCTFDLCTCDGGYSYDLSWISDTYKNYDDDYNPLHEGGIEIPLIDRQVLLDEILNDDGSFSEIYRIENFEGTLYAQYYTPIYDDVRAGYGLWQFDDLIWDKMLPSHTTISGKFGFSPYPIYSYDEAPYKYVQLARTDGGGTSGWTEEDEYTSSAGTQILHSMGGVADSFYTDLGCELSNTWYLYVEEIDEYCMIDGEYISVEEAEEIVFDDWLYLCANEHGAQNIYSPSGTGNDIKGWTTAYYDKLPNDYSEITVCLPFYDVSCASGVWDSEIYKTLFASPCAERFWRFSLAFDNDVSDGSNDSGSSGDVGSGGAGPGGGANGGGFGGGIYGDDTDGDDTDGDDSNDFTDVSLNIIGWLGDTVGGFFDVEFFPGFSLGGLLVVIMSFGLVLILFRWLGGT